jgi:hypothetical protein
MKDKTRLFLWPVLVIGVALVVFPFATSMPGRTAAAQRLMDDFEPVMTGVNAAQTAGRVYESLADAGHVEQAKQALSARAPRAADILFAAASVAKAETQKVLGPEINALAAGAADFKGLGGLSALHYLTWIFVVPGALLVILAGLPLAIGLSRRRPAV